MPYKSVPTAERGPVQWRYMLAQPADGWEKPGFDDSAWQHAPAPFGSGVPQAGGTLRTPWADGEIWMRRTFECPKGLKAGPVSSVHPSGSLSTSVWWRS